MARFPLAIPPGVYRNGTEYQSKGRYYDAYAVRWYPALGPIGGWQARSSSKPTGMARASIAWKTNNGTTYLAVATESHLYISNRAGTLFDITPLGFTSGRADASGTGGYGTQGYGSKPYGVPRPDNVLISDATVWTLDTWGEDLLGISPDDGKIYEWALDTGTAAAQVSGSPNANALVVTAERFVFALGTDNPRTVSWCDQEDNTDWTPSTTNQAGSFPLQTAGRLMCGKRVRGATILFTDVDAWLATYIGGVLIYSFEQVGDSCGIISRGAAATFDQQVAWMSQSGFWLYNGYAQPIPCDVHDYVFSDMNPLQVSKIITIHTSANFEIEWQYCSAESTEIDRAVIWTYAGPAAGTWNIGRPARTTGVDAGAFRYPIKIGTDGTIYDHETGFQYDTAPYAEAGPIEIGNGDNVVHCRRLIPDEKTSGDCSVRFSIKFEPNGTETQYGPYSLSAETDIRFVARQAKIRYTGVRLTDWRIGAPRIEGELGGER